MCAFLGCAPLLPKPAAFAQRSVFGCPSNFCACCIGCVRPPPPPWWQRLCVCLSEDRRMEGVFLGEKPGGQENCAPAWLEIEFSLPAFFFFFLNLIISWGQGNSTSWYRRPLCVSGNYQQIDGVFLLLESRTGKVPDEIHILMTLEDKRAQTQRHTPISLDLQTWMTHITHAWALHKELGEPEPRFYLKLAPIRPSFFLWASLMLYNLTLAISL